MSDKRDSYIVERLSPEIDGLKKFTESVVEIVQDGLIAIDENGRVLYFNRAAQDILGYEKGVVIGRNIKDFISADDLRHILSGKFKAGEAWVGRETMVKRVNGEKVSIGYSTAMFTDENGDVHGHIITFKDLTEIHRMQEEILRMDRLASLGEISSGIAHEIRNPLAAIKTTAQAMEGEVAENDPKREFLSRIVKEIDRLDTMLRTFFSFAKPKSPLLTRCDIKDVIREVLLLLNKDITNNRIEVVEKYAPDIPNVYADFHQMQQVFLNLFLNSIFFMDSTDKPKIFIAAWAKKDEDKEDDILEISVTDTGIGIDDEYIDKIFDPFFTTRAKGAGLGLSITYRIIEKHGGSIKASSKKGKGTTFIINLPALI